MYRIGLFSKINKVTIKTLRYYDEIGLLKPAFVDEENGYRYYTSEQLPTLHKIIALRQIGFSIDEIMAILKGGNISIIFEERKQEIETSIEEKRQQLFQITYYLEKMKEDFNMNYEIVLKELPEVIVYSKRMVIPNYDYYFEAIPQIGKEVTKANPELQCTVPEYCFIIYHDGEYKDQNIDVEFCESVTAFGTDTETIKFKKIEKVPTAACVYHKGPYSTIGKAYAHLFKWIADNGYTPSDNPRESYIDGIWNKENENDWLTELQVPVMKNK
ncbi:Multidrug-efflux transporter 1 regulator [Clostridium formicaceticum]|uniref:MerR family transcriptional regulator n=1 Tax=Clostridium formicaceticum TaxID=1497 RepID=A0AAC9WHA7_9CLOT|nr:MerR family transcriptional regulator [Clostridium formicaceticum]ARE87510.1 Multidrug-efflux transporter 1 regulator [Clostridium formicaceticum]